MKHRSQEWIQRGSGWDPQVVQQAFNTGSPDTQADVFIGLSPPFHLMRPHIWWTSVKLTNVFWAVYSGGRDNAIICLWCGLMQQTNKQINNIRKNIWVTYLCITFLPPFHPSLTFATSDGCFCTRKSAQTLKSPNKNMPITSNTKMQDYVILYRTAYLFLSGFILLVQGQWKKFVRRSQLLDPKWHKWTASAEIAAFCLIH